MKKNIFLILTMILLFVSGNIFSQNVIIKGKVSSQKKKSCLIRLLTFNEMLTYEQTLLCETQSDNDGNFSIEADIDDITMAQIAVDLERVDILLKPKSNYELEIVIPQQENDASYFERESPTLRMINADDDDLYLQYYNSNVIIDDFLLKNFNKLYRARQLSLLDTLDVEIAKDMGVIKSEFVKDNVRYRKAAIQMMINNDNARKVVSQYFSKQEILYSQPAYMNLFKEIFTDYLTSRQFNPSDIQYLLYADYDKFLAYLNENDVFLSENPYLAEIIIAWNLKRIYYEMPDEKNRAMNFLNVIAQNTKNQDNKQLVDDIVSQLNFLSFNTEAPSFSLSDSDGHVVNMSDYKDDMVLLQFVDKHTYMTDYQFEMLKDFSQRWQDTIQIVTISTKDYFDDYKQIFDNKGYRWKLLNLDDDILLLERYQIRTFPDYIILGKDGKIGMSPAPAPDQHLDFHVRRLYKYYKK